MFIRKTMEDLNRSSATEAKNARQLPVLIILDNVRSMHNVGSAFRTADALGAAGIYLTGFTPTPPHRDIRKTALGAEESVRWKYFSQVSDALLDVQKEGYKIISVEQVHGSKMLGSFEWKNNAPLALVFGNEVSGVSDDALAASEICIEIPQQGMKHSLNISVSVGVVLWELSGRMMSDARQ